MIFFIVHTKAKMCAVAVCVCVVASRVSRSDETLTDTGCSARLSSSRVLRVGDGGPCRAKASGGGRGAGFNGQAAVGTHKPCGRTKKEAAT